MPIRIPPRAAWRLVALGALILLGAPAFPAVANEQAGLLRQLVAERIRPILGQEVLVAALRAQNAATAALGPAEIEGRDAAWRAEVAAGAGPTLEAMLARPASLFLKAEKEASDGLYSELILMDARGLNTALSDVSSDLWQGDEAKWQETFARGPDAVFIDTVEFDESSQTFQSQVSVTMADPATGEPLGALTVGVVVERLLD